MCVCVCVAWRSRRGLRVVDGTRVPSSKNFYRVDDAHQARAGGPHKIWALIPLELAIDDRFGTAMAPYLFGGRHLVQKG